MEELINRLIENKILSENDGKDLLESFNNKLSALSKNAEQKIREEYAVRFETDKERLIDALDIMISEKLSFYEKSLNEEIEKNKTLREAIKSKAKELHKSKKEKNDEALKSVETSIFSKLEEELKDFHKEYEIMEKIKSQAENVIVEGKNEFRNKLNLHKAKLTKHTKEKIDEAMKVIAFKEKQLNEKEEALEQNHLFEEKKRNAAIKKAISQINEMVNKSLIERIESLANEEKALIETRAKLLENFDAKVKQAQRKVIEETAKKAEFLIHNTLANSMHELKEDIEEARKAKFGKKLFESFSEEFALSHYSETNEIKKANEQINKLSESIKKLEEKNKMLQESVIVNEKKAKKLLETVEREKILNSLLSNLVPEKRSVMKNLLESVKTEHLSESFNKYLDSVLGSNVAKQKSKLLVENKDLKTLTGDNESKVLNESKNIMDSFQDTFRLAGVEIKGEN